eukprot:TRINITY_DN724_c1_g1_i1.p1 TRINITY_DN724_c1_g1~~TRINITY_DN724_c1_g1_i1.p1  ORF type:complete len:537 (-),score=117.77 TRINITY_DN724_c1_g1_i1:283-1659(-)
MHAAMQILDEEEAIDYRNKELAKLAREMEDSMGGGASEFGRTVTRSPMPAFPALHFEFHHVSPAPLLLEEVDEDATIDPADPVMKLKMAQPVSPSLHLPATSSYNAFQHIISVYKQARLTEREQVRVGVAGNDEGFHDVLCGYVGMLHRAPEAFTQLDFKFYVIPIGQQSTIGNFLSAYDGWYAQHIGHMANPRPTSPHLSSLDHAQLPKKALQLLGLHEDSTSASQTPVTVLTEDLHHFIRGATYITPVQVFQVELWDQDTMLSNPVRPIIPFCARIEIGMPAYLADFVKQNKIPAHQASYANVKQNKKFSFTPMTLGFTFHEASYHSHEKYSSIKAKCYKSVVIHNVPAQGDKGVVASPTTRWLEMQAKECVGVPTGSKAAYSSKIRTQLTSYHVSYVEIGTEAQKFPAPKFPLMVDGQYLGEFVKIRIQRCKSPINPAETVTFPLASFLPLDLTD